jgi:hypothetical protein
MRYVLLALGIIAGASAFTTIPTTKAEAVVCARGVARSGCAGPNGAVVRRHGVVVAPRPVVVAPVVVAPRRCAWVWVNGVRVCR